MEYILHCFSLFAKKTLVPKGKIGMYLIILIIVFSIISITFLIIKRDRMSFYSGIKNAIEIDDEKQEFSTYTVNFIDAPNYQILPYYIDLDVGDKVQVIKDVTRKVQIRVIEIKVENRSFKCPRVRVILDVDGKEYVVRCGMLKNKTGGIGPIQVNGVNIGVEITEILFSSMTKKSSPFNNYSAFKLEKDLRLAVWNGKQGILKNTSGVFVVNQPDWTKNKYGNWLMETSYGLHSAIDIFATQHGIPEEVRSPVDGVVYRVYNKNTHVDSKTKNKAINIYSDIDVGPNGEKILFRFQHLSKILVSDGDHVSKGQVIGLTGHTGFNSRIGDHLHFEIRLNPSCFGQEKDMSIFQSIPVNPYNYLLEWWENRMKANGDKANEE